MRVAMNDYLYRDDRAIGMRNDYIQYVGFGPDQYLQSAKLHEKMGLGAGECCG